MLIVFALLVGALTSCGSTAVNEVKKGFAEMVAEKVQAASVHSLECKTGSPVYEDVKAKMYEVAKVNDGSQKSVILVKLCEQGVIATFPMLTDMGDGKIPEAWKADGCKMESISEDIEKFAITFCAKLE